MSQKLTTKEAEKSTSAIHMTTGTGFVTRFHIYYIIGIGATILSTFIAYLAIVQLKQRVMVADITHFVGRL